MPKGNERTKALSRAVKLALPAEIEGEESHCGRFYILKTELTSMIIEEAAISCTLPDVSTRIARGIREKTEILSKREVCMRGVILSRQEKVTQRKKYDRR